MLDALAEGEAEAILRTLIEAAKRGDVRAAEAILARLWAPQRNRPVRLDLPPIQAPEDLMATLAAITQAVAAGEITPTEGNELAGLVEAQRKMVETGELAERIERLEQLLEKRRWPSNP